MLAIFLTALLTSTALAELSAEVDFLGNYIQMYYDEKETGKTTKIWTQFGKKHGRIPLNEDGDNYGDLRPAFKENIYQQHFPSVVWPKFDGFDYEIAFSKWTLNDWAPIVFVEDVDNPFDDLDPGIDFDENARPYVAWWRDENGIGRIYISLFLETVWMVAYPISEEGIDCRNPVIKVMGEGVLDIAYSTEEGTAARTVIINFPSTITDDIDPFGADMVDIINQENGDYLDQ
jgi:hypothetical protein